MVQSFDQLTKWYFLILLLVGSFECRVGETPHSIPPPVPDSNTEGATITSGIKHLTQTRVSTQPYWFAVTDFPDDHRVFRMIDHQGTLIFATSHGLYVQAKDGVFYDVTPDIAFEHEQQTHIVDLFAIDNSLFAAFLNIGLYHFSINEGHVSAGKRTYYPDNISVHDHGMIRIRKSPNDANKLYAMSHYGEFVHSVDRGLNWETKSQVSGYSDPIVDFVVTPDEQFIVLTKRKLFVARDTNILFVEVATNYEHPSHASGLFTDENFVWIAHKNGGFARSDSNTWKNSRLVNDSNQWSFNLLDSSHDLILDIEKPIRMRRIREGIVNYLLFGGENAIYTSDDDLSFVNRVTERDVSELNFLHVYDILVSNNVVYVGTSGGLYSRKVWWDSKNGISGN